MSGQKVCDDLLKTSWQKYTSSVPEKPGIYAIGQKGNNGEETEYLYVGRSNNMKRRLQEHKSPTPQQDIDERVAGKFKQRRESELRVKCVPTKRQKTVEGSCIESLTKKKGYFPVLNKRAGDGSMANAACSKSNPPKSRPKVQSSGGGSSSVRSIQPSGGTSYMLPSGDVSWFSFEARPASSADRTSFFRGIPSSSSLRHGPLQVPQNFIGGWPSSVRSIRPSGGTCYVRESGSASWFSSKASSVPTVRASFGASRRRK